MVVCSRCGKQLEDGEYCYQVRYGYIESDDFTVEEDVELICEECFDE